MTAPNFCRHPGCPGTTLPEWTFDDDGFCNECRRKPRLTRTRHLLAILYAKARWWLS
jgi:hypothetical protein